MAIPKLALIPSTVGGSVYSVLPSNGDGDFDFTRGTIATRINAQGLIETVAVGDNRLNYPLIDGVVQGCPSLLLEPSRTNLVTYSEDFSNAAWPKIGITVTANNATSPSGYVDADKLIADVGTGNRVVYQAILPVGVSTVSVYAKAGGFEGIVIASGNQGGFFNLTTGAYRTEYASAPTAYSITSASNGWYRFSVTFTSASVDNLYIGPNDNVSTILGITGNGVDGIYAWGAQLEAGSYATSYIPSLTGSQTTRSAETCNNAGDVNTFNDSEGVLMLESNFLSESLSTAVIAISDGTPSNRIILGYFGGNSQLYCQSIGGVSAPTSMSFTVSDVTLNSKILIKYKEDDFAFWVNGFKIAVRNSGTVPSGLSELAFDSGGGLSNLYGNTKQIQYFTTALNDSDLETLTSWDSFSDMANGQLYSVE